MNDIKEENKMEETENKEFKSITLKVFEFFENVGLWILRKVHLKWLADFYNKYIEVMRYLICGALSTVVNIVAYIVGSKVIFAWMASEQLIVNVSEIFAFVIALIFAYWVNKCIVFKSKCENFKALFKEATSFVGARIFSEFLSIGLMNIAVIIHFNDVAMKVIANVVVVIVNYIFSKLIIFKKK